MVHPSPGIWFYHPSQASRVQLSSSSSINSLLDENFSMGIGVAPTSSDGGVRGVVSGWSKTNISTEKITVSYFRGGGGGGVAVSCDGISPLSVIC